MNELSKSNLNSIIQLLQLVVLIFGVAGVFAHIGSRDNQLETNTKEIDEIQSIAKDLLEAQITSVSNDAQIFEALQGLKDRVLKIERTQ